MPGKAGFDFNGASQSFNVLAEFLYGKNMTKVKMEMTTHVSTRKAQSVEDKLKMTTPVHNKECYIRHIDGVPISSEAKREGVALRLEAAIQRKASVV